jgi:hypothetical protein
MPRRVERRSARSGSEARNLDISIGVRFSADDLADIERQAEIAGISPGKFIRRRALGHPILAKSDMTVLNELRRLGGLVKFLYNEGALSSARGNLLLTELVAAIRRVGGDDA